MDTQQVALLARYADILQIGARNMQNYNLLKEIGVRRKPVLLKRGISATIESVREDAGRATLDVVDGGPGIRPADLPHVCDRFWRADDAPEGGTGRGLAIAAWSVERHGGTIAASNRPEGGAHLSARFPMRGARPVRT